jgi:hypothetical protein
MTSLSELRSTLAKLEAYELPEILQTTSTNDDTENNTPEQVLERYQKARDEYLGRRAHQVFYEHLGAFDGESVPMPEAPTPEEIEELSLMHRESQQRLHETANLVQSKFELLKTKYETFVHRREDIAKMIQDMEESMMDDDDDKENGYDNTMVEEEDLVTAEQECAALAKRRAELELKLTQMKAELAAKEKKLAQANQKLNEIRQSEDAPLDVVTADNMDEFQVETQELKKKAEKFKEMSEWYDTLGGLMEELTGVKIMSVTSAAEGSSIIFIKVLLLGAHQVEIALKPDQRRHQTNNLRIDHAKFLTPTLIKSSVAQEPLQLHIPEIHDLVRLSSNLGPVEDLRFLLRETMARVRAYSARVDELAVLRSKYVTKIGKIQHSSHSFGGEDQEVVCSVHEGITVVLRLTPDCPVVSGSSHVDQIVGVSGWEQAVLDEVKDTINAARCRGPLQLMELLKQELERLQKENGVALPSTPSMPQRRAK